MGAPSSLVQARVTPAPFLRKIDGNIVILALTLIFVGTASAAQVDVESDPSLANSRIFPPSLATSGVAVPSPAIDGINWKMPLQLGGRSRMREIRHAHRVAGRKLMGKPVKT